jgi:hypothetical protein
MRTTAWFARLTVAGMLLMTSVAHAQATKEQKAIASALGSGKHLPLLTGMETASAAGKPISARYEYEDNQLKLSVFIEKDGAFSEVFIDHVTGKVARTDKITSGDDMKDAKAQSKAFAKAKSTLAAALQKALTANPGYTAIEVVPVLQGGRTVADITLMKDGQFKDVSEPIG